MKELKKSALINEKKKSRVMTEKEIFRKVNNPFVVKLHYAFQTGNYYIMLISFNQILKYFSTLLCVN